MTRDALTGIGLDEYGESRIEIMLHRIGSEWLEQLNGCSAPAEEG